MVVSRRSRGRNWPTNPPVSQVERYIESGARASMPRKQYWSNGDALRRDPGGGGRWLWGLLRHRGWLGPNPVRTGFITGLNRPKRRLGGDSDETGVSRSLVLCHRQRYTLPFSLRRISRFRFPFLFLFHPALLPSRLGLFTLTIFPLVPPPSPCLHPCLACLSPVYGLLFANSAPTIDASRLIANPSSVYPSYLFPLTRAVNEIHAEDINRHSLRSRWVSRRPETRVRKYVCEMRSAGNAKQSRAFD